MQISHTECPFYTQCSGRRQKKLGVSRSNQNLIELQGRKYYIEIYMSLETDSLTNFLNETILQMNLLAFGQKELEDLKTKPTRDGCGKDDIFTSKVAPIIRPNFDIGITQIQ